MAGEPELYASGMGIVAELLVREVLFNGLHELANDEVALAELVQRVDTLRDGSQDTWTADLVAAFRSMMDPASDDYLQFRMGLPFEAGHLPCVSLIKEAGAEDTGGAVAGDVLDEKYVQIGTYDYTPQAGSLPTPSVVAPVTGTPLLEKHTKIGTAWTTTVQVGSWTTSVELSLVLDAAINHVLFRDKGRLAAAGVVDVGLTEGGSPTDESQQVSLRVGYVPLQRVTLDWIRAQTFREPGLNRIRILPSTFSA